MAIAVSTGPVGPAAALERFQRPIGAKKGSEGNAEPPRRAAALRPAPRRLSCCGETLQRLSNSHAARAQLKWIAPTAKTAAICALYRRRLVAAARAASTPWSLNEPVSRQGRIGSGIEREMCQHTRMRHGITVRWYRGGLPAAMTPPRAVHCGKPEGQPVRKNGTKEAGVEQTRFSR